MPTSKNSEHNYPLGMDCTSGPNTPNNDWKLNPNIQVKVVLKRLEIPNDVQNHVGHVQENYNSGSSTPSPRSFRRKRMSLSSSLPQTQTETNDPPTHLNSGESQAVEELQKIVQEFQSGCDICCEFVNQFSQHIRDVHSTSQTAVPSQDSGSCSEIETETNIFGLPHEIIPLFSLTGECIKCEPGEIETTDIEDSLHFDSEDHHGCNTGTDFSNFQDHDIEVKDEVNDSYSEFEFQGEYALGETVSSPPTNQELQSGENLSTGTAACDKRYKCDQCEAYFSREDTLKRHLLRKHPGELPYKCDVCQAVFKKFARLTRHKKTHIREQPPEKLSRSTSAVLHKIHESTSNDTDKDSSPPDENLQTHLESHSQPIAVPTQLEVSEGPLQITSGETETDSGSTSLRRNLRRRKSINYAELNDGPPPSTTTFTDGPVLPVINTQRHQILPTLTTEIDTLVLDVCDDAHADPLFTPGSDRGSDDDNTGDISDSDSKKDPEEYTTTNAKSTVKRKCDSQFTGLDVKRIQILKKQPGAAPYECGVCYAGFPSFEALALHQKTHTVDKILKIYKCKTCKFYGSPSDLAEHSKVHQRRRTHKHGKTFMLVSNLIQRRKHRMNINDTKSHKCGTCGKYFSNKCVLTMHKRLHTGKRPYKCDNCGKRSLSNAILIKHKRCHCKSCGQQFCDPSILKAHMSTHTTEESIRNCTARLKSKTCEKCNVRFHTKMEINRHNCQIHNTENPAKRSYNRNRFTLRRLLLKQRRRIQTDKELHKCGTCGKCFSRKDWLTRHENLHVRTYHYSFVSDTDTSTTQTNPITFTYNARFQPMHGKCSICRGEFPSVKELNAHLKSSHKNNLSEPYKCNICKTGFSTSAKIHNHVLQKHANSEPEKIISNDSDSDIPLIPDHPYKCEHCSRTFELPQHLEAHLAAHTKEKPYKCETCEKCFYVKDVLISHSRQHKLTPELDRIEVQGKSTNNENYGCGFCSIKYSSLPLLTKHLKRRHPNLLSNQYPCKFCKDEFFSIVKLNTHVRQIHPDEKPNECTICHKNFAKKHQLMKHAIVHKDEETIPCTYKGCSKMFKNTNNLKSHLLIHAGVKPFSCDECDKSFADATNLRLHKAIHTGDKPFMCDKCSSCFPAKSSLKIHMSIHNEEGGVKVKPHVCKDCGKSFTQKSHLTTHAKSHTGEKPHMCEECGICFGLPHQLRRHLKTRVHAKSD